MAVKVMQVDYDTLEPIEIYDSVREAAYDNWIHEVGLNNKLKKGNGLALYNDKNGRLGRKLAFKRIDTLKPV